jgi:hypothetical protein
MIRVKQNVIKDRIADDAQHYPCTLCGNRHTTVEFWFDSGSVEPTVGETLTGATSGDTGVVVSSTLYTGTFAGGDAKGTVELSDATGVSLRFAFEEDEAINGSTGGDNMMTTDSVGSEKVYGRLYPDDATAMYNGKRYCLPHYFYVSNKNYERDAELDIREEGWE